MSDWDDLLAYMLGGTPATIPQAPAPQAAAFGYTPPASGSPYGRIESVPLAAQTATPWQGNSWNGIPLNPGVPAPVGPAADLIKCIQAADPNAITRITSTSEPSGAHGPTDPHMTDQAADVATNYPNAVMALAAACGAPFQLNEYLNRSPGSNGGHVHLQTRPGVGGATGPYPSPPPKPRPDF
jgi:hypothetical protein